MNMTVIGKKTFAGPAGLPRFQHGSESVLYQKKKCDPLLSRFYKNRKFPNPSRNSDIPVRYAINAPYNRAFRTGFHFMRPFAQDDACDGCRITLIYSTC
jgi:hypothetical protein